MEHILIADDETTFLHATADLMRQAGFQVTCAEDSEVATRNLATQSYDLLIADIMMPGNADLGFIQDVARQTQGLPVILVTGHPSLRSAVSSIELPVTAYLVKPFEFDDLLNHVQRALQRRRLLRVVDTLKQRLRDWQCDLDDTGRLLGSTARGMASPGTDLVWGSSLSHVVHSLTDLTRGIKTVIGETHGAIDPAMRAPAGVDDGRFHAMPRDIRLGLERLANNLEEFGIVINQYKPANRHVEKGALRNLSQREWEVLRHLRAHHRVPTIARMLHVSPHTVRNHLKSIFRKLEVHTQEELLKLLDES